jgi:hypothetical protein
MLALGPDGLEPPRPKIFCRKFCRFSPIWLQVLTGAVASRKAT